VNIINDVKNYLDGLDLDLYAPIGLEAFGLLAESIVIRSDPSEATVTEFIDGSSTGRQSISFYARSKAPTNAIEALVKIKNALDKTELSLTDVLCIRVTPRTLPAIVEKNDTGEFVYTMVVDIEFDNNNKF
jgi:predicted lipid carrier protein YhbT